jgi:YbbR domain-containing protein
MKKKLPIIIIAIIFSIVLWVSISLSNDYYATFSVPLRLVNFPDGYTTGSQIPKHISVKLRGKGWRLAALKLGRESDYDVSAGSDSGKKSVNLYNFSMDNQWLTSDIEIIDISPDTLSFDVEKIVSKRVEIVPDLNINFKPGFGLATEMTISPESTWVFGPKSKIRDIRGISTEKVSLNNLDDKVEEKIPLQNIPEMNYSNSYINVILDVQKIVDKNFDNLTVDIIDVPSDRNVVLLPNKISVGLRGGVDVLAKLDNSRLKAHINYREVVLDTLGSVTPQIDLPENTSLLYIKPERLRYIIKKFN